MAGIDSDLIRGHIDTIILKSLYDGDKYGLEIIQEIEEKSNGSYELKQPTLYSCLKRLEGQGLISSYWEDSEIGGKRHYYTLTDLGKETYKNNQEEWLRSREIIDGLIYNNTKEESADDSNNESNLTTTAETPIIDQEEPTETNVIEHNNETFEANNTYNEDFDIENESTHNEFNDYLADNNQTNEFATFEEIENTAFNTFFEANNEVSDESEFDEDDDLETEVVTINTTSNNDNFAQEEPSEELVSLNIDDEVDIEENLTEETHELTTLQIDEDNNEEAYPPVSEVFDVDEPEETLTETTSEYLSFIDAYPVANNLDTVETTEESLQNSANNEEAQEEIADNEIYEEVAETSYDDEIYNPEPEIPEEEQIYVPDTDVDETPTLFAEQVNEEEPAEKDVEQESEIVTPTYINFDNTSFDEVDITKQDYSDEPQEQEETEFTENYFLEIEPDDDKQELSIQETAEIINEQYNNQTLQRASQEEIDSLYRTTENYENLQAGYTDETYKQMLNELESYSSTDASADTKTRQTSALSYSELSKQFEEENIVIRKYEKQIKESNETKIYVKTNKIHLIKNWITFGITAFALLLTFLIMNAFKESYTYSFAFWQFAVAFGVAILIPLYSTIKYAINPYKKVVAKYAPRLNILISALITIQFILIIYCVNLQLGFYSFSQENYNHLLWILPLILSFIPFIQSLIYYPLYNSKNYHT